MATPVKPPPAPNPGIPTLLNLLKEEQVNPNKVFVAAFKHLAEKLEEEQDSVKQATIAAKCIAVYLAAIKQLPELMHENIAVPSGGFISVPRIGNGQAGGIYADKRNSPTTRMPKPGTFAE